MDIIKRNYPNFIDGLPDSIKNDLQNRVEIQMQNELQNKMSNLRREQNDVVENITKMRKEKEAEELRRHNELILAIKSASENGATILIGDNANSIQIQQNTSNSSQEMISSVSFDYEEVLKVLKEIQGYVDLPQFQTTFNTNTENVKMLINELIESTEQKQNATLIKKSLHLLKNLAIGASSSLIASGMLALLGTIKF